MPGPDLTKDFRFDGIGVFQVGIESEMDADLVQPASCRACSESRRAILVKALKE